MKTQKLILAILFAIVSSLATYSQVGIGTTTPNIAAALDIESTIKGFLMPRMTTAERNLIQSVPAGLMVYNKDTNKLNFFNGLNWIEVTGTIVGGATVSDAPTAVTAIAGNEQAVVTFTPPVNNGGAPITNYIVTTDPAGGSGQGGTSPITVTGLTNGVSYTFTVVAVNAVGNSVASAPSDAVTPVGSSSAPTNVVASYTQGATSASISFDAPTNTGGAPITGYTVTSNPGGLTGTGNASPIDVSNLVFGTTYTFTVVANNGTVDSAPSDPSASITVLPNAPSAPLNVVATSTASGEATVTFDIPASDGGGAITNYVVTSTPAGGTGSGNASPITVTGLTNGTEYTFTVVAQNTGGDSPASAASNAVIPVGTPDAPTNVVATYTQGETTASITFDAPANTGGVAIVNYTVTSSPGGITSTASASPITISGLEVGTSYTFTVVANNGTNVSAPSTASNAITPAVLPPGAPAKLAVLPGSGQNTLSWEAPTTGGPVVNYIVQTRSTFTHVFVTNTWTDKATVSGSTLTWSDVNNVMNWPAVTAIEYHYRVVAVNASGEATSEVSSATPVANSTVIMHDNFNAQPTTPNWEYIPHAGMVDAGVPTNNLSNLDPLYIGRMYDQADGRWKITKPDPASMTNGITASTTGLMDRSTNNIVIQFDYMPVNGSYQPQVHAIGLVDQSGRRFHIMLNSATNIGGVSITSFTGNDWNAQLGASLATPASKNINSSAVSSAGNPHVHYKIVLPSTGGIQVWTNGAKQTEWSATEIPAAYNNLKFYVHSSRLGNGANWTNIDNFTIMSY